MGKKRHSKDKLYLVAKEYAEDWGGYKAKKVSRYNYLPFFCCSLSLSPFSEPVCTNDGIIFDAANIIPYIKEHGKNPVNGECLNFSDLKPLKFHKNSEGNYHCPVTLRVFNENSYIVANRKSGNVYSRDAMENLCRKTQSWFDLMDGEPFSPSDLVVIQDPAVMRFRDVASFNHVKNQEESPPKESQVQSSRDSQKFIVKDDMMERVFKGVDENKAIEHHQRIMGGGKAAGKSDADGPSITRKHPLYTTHRLAAGFTSSAVDRNTTMEYRDMTEEEIMQEVYQTVKLKNLKGYVQLFTSKGNLNLELHCDLAPLACDSFLRHCETGYYSNTKFHRCIANFMIQGGDPTGTGKGGISGFPPDGLPFKDEFHPRLTHKGLGVVSMANSGKNTNKSQFFITFKSCTHLDRKHSIFGRVVGGMEVLKSWEALQTDKLGAPKDPPVITSFKILRNPFKIVKGELYNEPATAETPILDSGGGTNSSWKPVEGLERPLRNEAHPDIKLEVPVENRNTRGASARTTVETEKSKPLLKIRPIVQKSSSKVAQAFKFSEW